MALLDSLLTPSALEGGAGWGETAATAGSAAPVLDMVLIASCHFYDSVTKASKELRFKANHEYNTIGNKYTSIDALMESNLVSLNASAVGGAAAQPGALSAGGGRRSLSAHAWQANEALLSDAVAAAAAAALGKEGVARSRRLELELQPLPLTLTSNATQQQFTFNIMAASFSSAASMRSSLIGLGKASVASAVTEGMANATGLTDITTEVNSDSVNLITLTYTRSIWALFWDFFLRNIINVCVGASVLSVGGWVIYSYNVRKRKRAKKLREAKEAALHAKLTEIQAGNRLANAHYDAVWNAGRWTRVRAALLAYLKKDVLSNVMAQVLRDRQAAAAAAAAAAATAAAEERVGGGRKRAPPPAGALFTLKAQSHAGTDKARAVLHPSKPSVTGTKSAEGEVIVLVEQQNGHLNGHSRAPLAPLGPAQPDARKARLSKLGWGGKKSLG